MAPLRRLKTDPTFPTSKFTSIKYPSKGLVNKPALRTMAGIPERTTASNAGGATSGDPTLNKGINVADVKAGMNDVLPYASNFVNSFRKLPKPIAPPLETPMSAELVNYDAARQTINNKLATFNRETDYKTSTGVGAQALKAKALASGIEGLNSLAQQEANTNAMIKNQTNQANQLVQARNVARQQEFNDNIVGRQIKQQEFDTENLADATTKYGLQRQDKALQRQEGRRLVGESFAIDESQLSPETLAKLKKFREEELKALEGYKFGGRLRRLK